MADCRTQIRNKSKIMFIVKLKPISASISDTQINDPLCLIDLLPNQIYLGLANTLCG